MNLNQKVALNIREQREKKGFNQQYMADSLEISKNSYSLIELGKTKLNIETLFRICEILEYPVAKALNINVESTQNNQQSIVITQNNNGTLFFELSDKMKEFVKNSFQ